MKNCAGCVYGEYKYCKVSKDYEIVCYESGYMEKKQLNDYCNKFKQRKIKVKKRDADILRYIVLMFKNCKIIEPRNKIGDGYLGVNFFNNFKEKFFKNKTDYQVDYQVSKYLKKLREIGFIKHNGRVKLGEDCVGTTSSYCLLEK